MKLYRLFLLGLFSASISLTSFGQEKFAKISSEDNFITENKLGVYNFSLPQDVTKEDVALSAEYYTMYFSVKLDEKSKIATVTMKDFDNRSKHIICRFLVSLGLQVVEVNETMLPVQEFFDKYLATPEK